MTSFLLTSLSVTLFQLTRSRGAWLLKIVIYKLLQHFNSHAHVERDYLFLIIVSKTFIFQLTRSRGAWHLFFNNWKSPCISTHTLTWSVTKNLCSVWAGNKFQLTRSRGAWPVAVRKSIHYLKNFNSHAHVERDRRNALHLTSWILFQLTRSRGAWRYWKMLPVLTLHFNSHAHVERDQFVF